MGVGDARSRIGRWLAAIIDRMDKPVPNNEIQISRIIRAKRKTIALVVERDGSLTVRAPLRMPMKLIQEFARKHEGWILKKQAQVRIMAPVSKMEYIPGETFPYLGRMYPLEIVKGQKIKLILDGNFKMAEASVGEGRQVFEGWYRGQAREILSERVRLFSQEHGFHYQKIRISSARTRWGSCNAKGSLSFSWHLILMPMEVVDYVVVHELCHTLVHNHSQKFWKQVERIMPNYNDTRKWLRKNGQNVML